MLTKGLQDLIKDAASAVPSLDGAKAEEMLARDDVVFVDVRESDERRRGFIPGSVHVPRGFLEFIADPAGPAHNPVLTSGKTLVLYCASGMRSLLAAKTLRDMGIDNLYNLTGGFHAWVERGAPVDL